MISMELASGSNPNKKGKRTKFIHGYILSVCSRPELPQAPNAYTLRAMWQEPSSYQLCLNCRWNDTLEPGQPRPKPIPSWFYILSPRVPPRQFLSVICQRHPYDKFQNTNRIDCVALRYN
eukprot:TRINITY_DN3560_c0_g1_i5.p1 TRINITY_DN3560_c0_g1~~TRINITY_DN3560_c0_g1_i5.p1  ORF type:complete len:120 (-),score=0.26 TRINITY_DN3560_c0_g1_i5:1-360(-)